MKKKICFTSPLGPLLNLAFGLLLVGGGWAWNGAVPGFPGWAFIAMGFIFLAMIPSSFRWMVMDEKGFTVRNWRVRVRMEYPEVERVEVVPKRISLLTRSVVHYAALRNADGRRTWIASWNFAFSRRCLAELGRRIRAARGKDPDLVLPPSDPPPMKRSPILVLLGGALAAAGVVVLFSTVQSGLPVGEARAFGVPGKARILSLAPEREGPYWDVLLERIPGGEKREIPVQEAWARGRKVGDVIAVKVHPADPKVFVLVDEGSSGWTVFTPAFIALVFLALGGRTFVRSLTIPTGVTGKLEEAFRASGETENQPPERSRTDP